MILGSCERPALATVVRAGLLAQLAVALLSVGTADAGLRYGDRISTAGLGPVEIGMTVSDASYVLGLDLDVSSFNPPCGGAKLSGRFRVSALTTGDVIARIYIDTPVFATRKRVRIGSSVRTLRRRYRGLLRSAANFYTQRPQYWFRRGNRAIVFDTNRGRVSAISTGRYPEIRYVEGCA